MSYLLIQLWKIKKVLKILLVSLCENNIDILVYYALHKFIKQSQDISCNYILSKKKIIRFGI